MSHRSVKLDKEDTKLHSVMELAALINSSLDPVEIRQLAVEAATRCAGADAASLLLLDQNTGELYFEVATGEKKEQLKEIRLKPGQGIAGLVIRRGGAMIIDDVQNDTRFCREVDQSTGYETRWIQGDEIPLMARIIAVADTFDAMTSDRPYRKALSHETALGELDAFSGIQFDPRL